MKRLINILILISFLIAYSPDLKSARIKDVAHIEGVSGVQVIGYGLVTGLNQSGDNQQTTYTVQSVSNMLKRFGLTMPERNPRVRNVAAVMITTTIPSFMKKGSKVDVVVSSIGDASSLQGGVLLMTPLSLSDGTIVGLAQGPISVGGYDFQAQGSSVSKNVSTTGRIPNGLILESAINSEFVQNNQVRIILREPDFTTAARVSDAVNTLSGMNNSAIAIDGATVQVTLPANQTQQQIMQMISQIELLNVISDPIARVVINERTGTVVVGSNVQLLPTVIAHGGLEISVQEEVMIPQQAAFTIRPPNNERVSRINAKEEIKESIPLVVQGATVQDLATALNLLKVSPRDLIAIFQALKESGALQGELILQ